MVIHPTGTRIKAEADLLFFTLFSCKSGLTYDVLGLVCGLDAAPAKRRQDEGLAVLREALRLVGCLPAREFQSPAELQRYFSKRRVVLLDATEFATQRPQKKTAQQARHRSKKTLYTQRVNLGRCAAKANLCGSAGAKLSIRFYAVKAAITSGKTLVF